MTSSDPKLFDNKKIIVFDGECAFCNRSVLFIKKHNRTRQNLYFCSSQSTAAKDLLSNYPSDVTPEESLIYIKNNKAYYYSSAALEISKELDDFWAMISIFLIVPKFIRDYVYKSVAKRRKQLLKGNEFCSLDEASQFDGYLIK